MQEPKESFTFSFDDRLELLDEYQKAKIAFEKAEARLNSLKENIKIFGSFTEGGYTVDVSVISRESVSLKEIKLKHPRIAVMLEDAGLISKSESERLSVKIKEIV